jgi:hypothetical protein
MHGREQRVLLKHYLDARESVTAIAARRDRAPRPLTKEIIKASIEHMTADENSKHQEQTRRRYGDLPYPDTLPACGRIIVDGEGNI